MIVVDTNLVARFVLRDEDPGLAERVMGRDPAWIAPMLLHFELRNVLVTCMRARRLTMEGAIEAASFAEGVVGGVVSLAGARDVLDLAERSRCTAYDCEFVAIARELGVPLVTSDRELLREFPDVAISPEAFVSH